MLVNLKQRVQCNAAAKSYNTSSRCIIFDTKPLLPSCSIQNIDVNAVKIAGIGIKRFATHENNRFIVKGLGLVAECVSITYSDLSANTVVVKNVAPGVVSVEYCARDTARLKITIHIVTVIHSVHHAKFLCSQGEAATHLDSCSQVDDMWKAILQDHGANHDVFEAALKSCFRLHPSTSSDELLNLTTAARGHHLGSSHVQFRVLIHIGNTVRRRRVTSSSAIQLTSYMVAVMDAHNSSALVQWYGCRAIAECALNSDAFKKILRRSRAAEVCRRALGVCYEASSMALKYLGAS